MNKLKKGITFGSAQDLASSINYEQNLTGQNYMGLEPPDPSQYILGTKSPKFQHAQALYNSQISQAEWEAQLAIMSDERAYAEEMYNKYNSPEAQARQMREAGLNPNLQGVSSQGMTPAQSGLPSFGQRTPVGETSSIAQEFFKLLPQAIQIYTGMKSSLQQSELHDLQIGKEMTSLAEGDLLSSLSVDDFTPTGEYKHKVNGVNTLTDKFGAISDARQISLQTLYGKGKKYNKRLRQYNDAFHSILKSDDYMTRLRGYLYDSKNTSSRARSEYTNILSRHGFNLPDDVFATILREVSSINFKNYKKQLENNSASSENDASVTLLARINKLIDSSDKSDQVAGWLLYILNNLVSQASFSTSRDAKGKTSINFGF